MRQDRTPQVHTNRNPKLKHNLKPHPIQIVSLALVLAALILGGQAAPAAQMDADDLLGLLNGLESAYARKYIPVADIDFATPTPAETPSVVLTTVLTFEDEASATSAFAGILNTLTAGIILGEPGADLEATDVNGLGDEARRFVGIEGGGDEEHVRGLLAVRDGNLGFLIQAHGSPTSVERALAGFGVFMVAAEPGSGPVMVHDLGATGGPFDLMPDNDDKEVLGGLFPVYDYDLLANGGEAPIEEIATPSASPGANAPMNGIRG
jgi:hypothetical protein